MYEDDAHLDDDVAARIERLRRERDKLKGHRQDALRRGLGDSARGSKQKSRSKRRASIWGDYGCPALTISVRASPPSRAKASSDPRRRNILTYSHVKSFAQHELARRWLDQQLSGSARVGLPWTSLLAFLRLVTNPRVFERPESISDTWRQVRHCSLVNRYGYRTRLSATLTCWVSFSLYPPCTQSRAGC
jgi:hypothetical protein